MLCLLDDEPTLRRTVAPEIQDASVNRDAQLVLQ
jgi:hypothetical protein